MVNLLNFDQSKMRAYCESLGEPAFRGTQLLKWIHQHHKTDFNAMHNISLSFRKQLVEHACIQGLSLSKEWLAADGTVKWLLKCDDGNQIEAVYIPSETRATLCVSSQVGCALQCDFCATGDQGFARNLTVAEIIGQLWFATQRITELSATAMPISNVVMMGMGEPLLNYDAVVAAMNLMLDDHAYGLSKYRVTLSTSGIVPAMQRLQQDSPVSLAVSLHASTNELRNELVPINKKHPLEDLMAVCQSYFEDEPRRQVTFEYVMLAGINDQPSHAKALVQCLQGMSAKVNLIPFNPYPGGRFQCTPMQTIELFQQRLMQAGIHTMVRRTRGDDVAGACGQLQGQFQDRTLRTAAGRAWVMAHRQQRTQQVTN